MVFRDYERHDALGLAELIRKRDVGSHEVLESAITRAETHGASLNAMAAKAYDLARGNCGKASADAPFAEVPFLLKDISAPMPGLPESGGSVYFRGYQAPAENELVRRFRRAGLNIFGRTTSAEFGLSFTTDSPAYGGPTRNPWDTALTPGGSSGGAAAAVAAGIVPMAHANDGGGSIRVPAACCGIYGLKPTRARLPSGPLKGEGWGGLSCQGVVSRSVRDSAAALEALQGRDLGAPYSAPQSEPFLELLRRPPQRLRIGFVRTTFSGAAIHADCVAAVLDAARLCEELGHSVEEAAPSYDVEGASRAMRNIVATGCARSVQLGIAALGREPGPDDLSPSCMAAVELGRRLSAIDYAGAIDAIHLAGRQIARFFVDHDLLLTPTTALPPVRADRFPMTVPDFEAYWSGDDAIFDFAPFTHFANISGQPAASVPLYWNNDGVPIGAQFVASFGGEAMLLRLSAQLEAARPWFDRRPSLAA